jgi:hypothetical protein
MKREEYPSQHGTWEAETPKRLITEFTRAMGALKAVWVTETHYLQ